MLGGGPVHQEEWVASQQDLLDLVWSLVVIWSQVNEGDPVRKPLSVAIRIWAKSFTTITHRRRAAILDRTNPGYGLVSFNRGCLGSENSF